MRKGQWLRQSINLLPHKDIEGRQSAARTEKNVKNDFNSKKWQLRAHRVGENNPEIVFKYETSDINGPVAKGEWIA